MGATLHACMRLLEVPTMRAPPSCLQPTTCESCQRRASPESHCRSESIAAPANARFLMTEEAVRARKHVLKFLFAGLSAVLPSYTLSASLTSTARRCGGAVYTVQLLYRARISHHPDLSLEPMQDAHTQSIFR